MVAGASSATRALLRGLRSPRRSQQNPTIHLIGITRFIGRSGRDQDRALDEANEEN